MKSIAAALTMTVAMTTAMAQPDTTTSGTVAVRAFTLPPSSFFTDDERAAYLQWKEWAKSVQCVAKLDTPEDTTKYRKCLEERFGVFEAKQKARYAAHIQPQTMAGVYTEVVTPVAGVSQKNRQRVLINLHGGAFNHGAGVLGRVESIPIAALGKITVVTVDYRQGPEHRFPAASEDVAAVYRELLKKYKPENVGIYGCSAGGVLTAQAVAWIDKQKLPRPGAAGMFCAAAAYWPEGDSGRLSAALFGLPEDSLKYNLVFAVQANPYLEDADPNDPLVFPVRSPAFLAKFPPSLLISSTRDLGMSSVVQTHAQLTKLGVPAELHIWEGLDHAFFIDPDFPQSREVYDVVVKFFDAHLGKANFPRSK